MINVVGFTSGNAVWQSFIAKDLIQDIWGWSFDSGTVVDVLSDLQDAQRTACHDAIAHFESVFAFSNPYCILLDLRNGNLSLACSKYPFSIDSSGVYRSYLGATAQTFKTYIIYSDYYVANDGVSSLFNPSGLAVQLFRGSACISADGLTLGQIQSPYDDNVMIDITGAQATFH